MRTPYKSEFANKHHAEGYDEGLIEGQAKGLAEGQAKGLAEGQAKGLARAVLELLESRKIRTSASIRSRIEGCHDEPQLLTWLLRAAHVATPEELFV